MPMLDLPWDTNTAENKLFTRVLRSSMAVFVVLAIALPLLPLDDISRKPDVNEPILTRVVLEKKVLPEPEPPPVVQPKPKKRIVKAQTKPAEKPVPKPKIQPKPEPVDTLAVARDTAAAAGVLAFQDDLQSLRDTVDVQALNQTRTSRGAASAENVQRAIITSKGPSQSSGVQTAALSTDTGGPALSGRETTAVTSTIAGTPRPGRAATSAQNLGGRSDDAIRRVMDQNKGAIFALYNRALRKDPLLEGKLVFEMVIEPDGSITELNLLSTELADPELTRRILSRINLIRFGQDDVLTTRVNYSFDFLPYT